MGKNRKTMISLLLSVAIILAKSSMDISAEETSQLAGTIQPATPSQSEKASQENTAGSSNEVRKIEEDGRKENVFQVILPTDTRHVFDFIMDPQELIAKTEAAAYGGSAFEEEATVFFKRSDGESEEDYSSCSDVVSIINAGTTAVNVSLTAYVSPDSIAGITMTDDPDFIDDENPSLYLALIDGEEIVPINSVYGASIDTWLEGAGEGDYNAYSFQLTGAVNRNGDWSELTDIAPEVTVTWKVMMDGEEMLEEKQSIEEDGKTGESESNLEKNRSNLVTDYTEDSEGIPVSDHTEDSESFPVNEGAETADSKPTESKSIQESGDSLESGSSSESKNGGKEDQPLENESIAESENTEDSESLPENENLPGSESSSEAESTKRNEETLG